MIYFGQKNGNVKTKGQQQTKKERTNNMKTISKITQTRHFKKIAAGTIATVMIGTMLMLPVNSKTEKRLLGGTSFSASADTAESGSCGENATWTLDTNGKLTISGTGAMTDFVNDDMQPWRNFRSSIISVEIEDGITNVGSYAFAYCSHLTMAFIANSVTTIGSDAFDCCTALSSANVPKGVTTIGFEAFYQCKEISYLNLPSTLKEIKDNAFFGCTNCKQINIDVTDPSKLTWKDSNDDFMPSKQTQCSIPHGTSDGYNQAFGDSVNVRFVDNKCGDHAQWDIDDNGTLTISGTGDMYDFGSGHTGPWKEYKDEIKKVVIEDGITSIGSGAFYNCQSITSVTIPDSVTKIGEDAFNNDQQLTEVNIPASVTTIDKYAFYYCQALKTVTFAEGSKLTAIEDSTFAYCKSLTEITIPKSVTKVGECAFYACSALKSATISEGVTTINRCAFAYNDALTSVTIPSTVTQINDNAFFCCKNCKDVHMLVTDPKKLTWEDKMVDDFMSAKMTKCHVPSAALGDYQIRFATSVNVTFVAAE